MRGELFHRLGERIGPPTPARRLVLSLCAEALLLWLGASALVPLLPAYLRRHGASPTVVGVVMAAYYAASVVTQYPAGRLSDRIGRRPVLFGGLVLFAAGSVGFAATSGAGAAIVFRALQGAGAGSVMVASAAMIGAELPAGRRGAAFGALYGSQMLSLAVGPLVGSIAGTARMGDLFVGAAVLAAIAAVPVGLARPVAGALGPDGAGVAGLDSAAPRGSDDVPPRGPARPEGPERLGGPARPEGAANVKDRWALAAGPAEALAPAQPPAGRGFRFGRAVIGVIVAFAASGVLIGAYETNWTLLLQLRGASNLEVGLSWTLFALPFAALSVPAGKLAERADRRTLTVASLLLSAVFAVVYTLIHSPAWLVGLATLEAVGTVAATPAAVLVLTEAVPAEAQGEAQGAVETARTAAAALAAAACGALFGVGEAIPFDSAAAVIVVGCVVIVVAWRHGWSRPAAKAGAAASAGGGRAPGVEPMPSDPLVSSGSVVPGEELPSGAGPESRKAQVRS